MAIGEPMKSHDDTIDSTEDIASDYGSDIDDATLDDIFSQSFSQSVTLPTPQIKVEDVDEAVLPERDDSETQTETLRLTRLRADVEHALSGLDSTTVQLAHIRETLNQAISGLGDTPTQFSRHSPKRARSVEIEYDESNRSAWPSVQTGDVEVKSESPPVEERNVKDDRSPIERFRTAPRKPLSVTDLVSPAWCELQYWYSLTKYGRVKRTPAMKQGSKIHKQMEEQVHTEVPVETRTKEDRLGLRMWNIIQGLRTLRATGLTRELEVFGILDGEVVIGIIDEISYKCPDEHLEAEILGKDETAGTNGKKMKKEEKLSPDQRTMNDFFPGSQEQPDLLNSQSAWLSGSRKAASRPLYLLDIKTRKSKTLPRLGSQMRPTQMQLMLYRRLLNDLAANKVEAERIFDRYHLGPHVPFSGTFIAQLGAIDLQSSQASSILEVDDSNDEMPSSQEQSTDPLEEVLAYNTLSSLWSHMIAEFSRTISVNASSSALSPLLTAEFRNSTSGQVIGQRSFAFDAEVLDTYIASEMQWWRGERETQGVEIEEAYKCGICEFAEGCTWRKGKIEETTKKARLRNQSRAKSQI